MKIFVVAEKSDERAAATPATVKILRESGAEILVQKSAGEKSGIADAEFEKAGAKISENFSGDADIFLAVNSPEISLVEKMRENAIWISQFYPHFEIELIKKFLEKKIRAFSLNLLPRITRAQKMDVLTSQSNLAGYKAVILAANELKKIFPLMMTAAGTIQPAKVVVLGAGVAGLQAIATAVRLGAQVEASDIRPIVKEQIESLGGKFIEVENNENLEDEKGYAKEASKDFLKRQSEEVARRIAAADIVISTALIPGRPAPKLISEKMVRSMREGSVIVDMAAPMGGNCELTEPGKKIEKFGVKIIGEKNLAGLISANTTQMFAKNLQNFCSEFLTDGKINFNFDDEIQRECCVTFDGKIRHAPTREILKI